ncbi:MAG: YetF domain-containing protein [Pseudomonadota bacterium]
MPDWITPFVDAAVMVPFMVLCVRLAGLRAFSKMSSYDFAVTVAFGSVLAGTVLAPGTSLWEGMLAMTALFGVQWIIGIGRSRSGAVRQLTDNEPILLMRNGTVLEANLRRSRVTRTELIAKLREANALDMSSVRAVVLETTGDVSVLHGHRLDETVLDGVQRIGGSS